MSKPKRPSSGRIPSRIPSVPRPSVPRPRGSGRTLAETRTSPISAIGALAVVSAVLVAGLGYGYATSSQAKTVVDQKAVKQLPLTSATAVCQGLFLGGGGDAFPVVSAFTPGTGAPGPKDTLSALYADLQPFPNLKPAAPGTRATTGELTTPHQLADGGGLGLSRPVPVVFQAANAYAPGFAAGVTLRSDSAQPRGLAATQCGAPSTDFWFAGVSVGSDRASKLELTNTDNAVASVNLAFFGPDGRIDTRTGGHDIVVQPHSSAEITLSGYLDPIPASETASVHVTTNGGRVAAAVLDEDQSTDPKNSTGRGMDFIPPQAATAPDEAVQVIAGIPAGGAAGKLQKIDLTLTATGTTNAVIEKVEWIGKSTITVSPPAAAQPVPGYTPLALPLTVPAGKTVSVDMSWLPVDGTESGTLRLTTSGGGVLSGIRVVAAAPQGALTDSAYLAPAQPITGQSVVVDNKTGGKAVSTLYLSDLGDKGATVKVTTIGADGKPADDTVQVPAGTTLAYPLKGTGEYTAVVQVQPGSDPVYGSRQMSDAPKNAVTTTLQTLEPTRLTAGVPPVAVDLSGAVRR
jgi:hypothetical protein